MFAGDAGRSIVCGVYGGLREVHRTVPRAWHGVEPSVASKVTCISMAYIYSTRPVSLYRLRYEQAVLCKGLAQNAASMSR